MHRTHFISMQWKTHFLRLIAKSRRKPDQTYRMHLHNFSGPNKFRLTSQQCLSSNTAGKVIAGGGYGCGNGLDLGVWFLCGAELLPSGWHECAARWTWVYTFRGLANEPWQEMVPLVSCPMFLCHISHFRPAISHTKLIFQRRTHTLNCDYPQCAMFAYQAFVCACVYVPVSLFSSLSSSCWHTYRN